MRNKILLIDDEPSIRFGIRKFLEAKGYEITEGDSCRRAEDLLKKIRPDAAIIDYMLPDGTALDLLPSFKASDPAPAVIVLTGHGSIELAVRAIKEGAEHFITKPVELPALLVILERLLENQRSRQKEMAKSRQARDAPDPFIGQSNAIRQLEEQARKVLQTDSPVLIQGETGSGKGILARWFHDNGARKDEAFVDLNCAGLTREFLESELFGHEKGAFTGAVSAKPGLLEVAHRGTVFLDEIGDVDLNIQPKLLKVLEEKRFRRLGDVKDQIVDIRLIAATHQDLAQTVRENKFRSDLYFRISTIPLMVPPLRQRAEDIPTIAQQILETIAQQMGRVDARLSPEAMEALKGYSWPGNIRELRNVLERSLLLSGRPGIEKTDLRFEFVGTTMAPLEDAGLTLEELERRHIERVLGTENWKVEQAARKLGIPRSSLYQKIKKYGFSKRPPGA
jgi:DNA-binding NtrC family response regulator